MSASVKEEMNTTVTETPKSVKPNLNKSNQQKGNNMNNKQNIIKKNLNNNNNNNKNFNNQNNKKKFNQNQNNNNNKNFNNQNNQNNNGNDNSQSQQQNQQHQQQNQQHQQQNQQHHQQNQQHQQQHHQQHNKFQNKNYHQSNENLNKQNDHSNQQNGGASTSGNHEYYQQNRQFQKIQLGQPTLELPSKENIETKKFTGRCRIFIANLPNNTTEESLKKLFEEFGEVSEVYLGKSNFAFVKMDTRKNAELAKNSIDGKTFEGRILRVRLAAHAAALRVKNLSNTVTNELLEYAFSYFGEVERAIVITDDRGRSIGEGIVEFARKFSAQNCLKRCSTECFLITSIPKPVYVEPFEQRDEKEGFSEKQINKNTHEFRHEREVGPRFAEPGTFEHEYAVRWMRLIELEKQKKENLEIEINEARKALQEQLEYSKVEHETKLLREQLREMEERADKFGQLRNTRIDDERRKEEERQKQLAFLRQQEEDIIRRTQVQDVSNLRRQENDLRSKANALQNLLDKQEQAIGQVANPVVAAVGMVQAPDQQLYQNQRINYNEPTPQLVPQQPQINQQPIYNTGMPIMPNAAMNPMTDFNRFGPQPVPAQPFVGQNPNGIPMNMNGPFNPQQQQQRQGGQNNRFQNNNNRNNFQQHGVQKRMRRY